MLFYLSYSFVVLPHSVEQQRRKSGGVGTHAPFFSAIFPLSCSPTAGVEQPNFSNYKHTMQGWKALSQRRMHTMDNAALMRSAHKWLTPRVWSQCVCQISKESWKYPATWILVGGASPLLSFFTSQNPSSPVGTNQSCSQD